MDENANDPFTQVAPDWINLIEVETWLTKRFSVPARSIIADLITAVRTGGIPHRVAGLKPVHLRIGPPGSPMIPPGIAPNNLNFCHVIDWEAARVDWASGTVAGRWLDQDIRARLKIEVPWRRVEAWGDLPLRILRNKIEQNKQKLDRNTSTENMSTQELKVDDSYRNSLDRSKGGAPQKHDWSMFWMEVAAYGAEHDLQEPDRLDLQKHMEEWTARKWLTSPDASTIRKKIVDLYRYLATRT